MRGARAIAVGLAILLSSQYCVLLIEHEQEPLNDDDESYFTSKTTGIVDLPTWRVNDRWTYNGELDVRDFIATSGVSTTVDFLEGSLVKNIDDIYVMTVDNRSTLVYEAQSDGTYEAEDIELDGNEGDLVVEIDTTEIVRASDLAIVSQEATIDIDFQYQVLWWTINIDVADLVITQTFSPPTEGYDFPLSVGDEWSTDYYQDTQYSGQSDYVDIPADESSHESSSWEVVSRGAPGVSYASCQQSYNITNYDSNGDPTGYRWFCPSVRGDVYSSFTQSIGFLANHELVMYQAAPRSKQISVELEYPLSPLNMEQSAFANVTQNGQVVSGQGVEFRYGIDEDIRSFTTGSTGSAEISFNSGNEPDDSIGGSDTGSHGVLVWIPNQKIVGGATITIDPNTYSIDLVARSEGVTVERTRDNQTTTLDSVVGFNAILGDTLTFSIPVQNRGITSSPATTLSVEAPDGTTSSVSVPSLPSLGQSRMEFDWTVPQSQPIGDVSLSFTVDPDEDIANDGNRSNNQGSFSLFIGRAPTASLSIPTQSLTLDQVSFNGLSSYDPDGGDLVCEFIVETLEGGLISEIEDDCTHEYSWDDDGAFTVRLVITDDENDQSSSESVVTILNRDPQVTVGSEYEWTPVLSPIEFNVEDVSDLDTQNPSAPVDILWKQPCEEGQVGIYCTVIPTSEGEYTAEVEVMDDDGAVVSATKTIEVRNIAPTNPRSEIWLGDNRLVADSRGVFIVNEGDYLRFEGWADDSENDMDTLVHYWSPDAEDNPDIVVEFTGRKSTMEYTYHTSGMHLATLQVVDNDGDSTESLIVPIEVMNIDPTISPLSPPLPAAEDSVVDIMVQITDTSGDMLTLTRCFDIDPLTNSDGEGTSSDDCDVESDHLSQSWPDATTAPQMIVFHVTDDDGSTASIEIPLDIRNVKPVPKADSSAFFDVPEGDVLFFTANGTTDSAHDMANMVYNWDMDISVDSNGDGDPENDVDIQGQWIEWTFNGYGSRTVKMTAVDESGGSSVTLTVVILEAPFSMGEFIGSYGIIIAFVLIVVIGAAVVLQRRRPQAHPRPSPGSLVGRRRVSMDDAFDDPQYDPFSKNDGQSEEAPPSETTEDPVAEVSSEYEVGDDRFAGEGVAEAFEELTGEKIEDDIVEEPDSEVVAVSVEEALDDEDIEALFED